MSRWLRSNPIFNLPASLRTDTGAANLRLLEAGLRAADPEEAVRRCLALDGEHLVCGGKTYDLRRVEQVRVVGAGKAGVPMLRAVNGILGDRLSGGVVVVKDGHTGEPGGLPIGVQVLESGHPIPDGRSVEAAQRILEVARGAGPRDLLIVLISGGGSTLMTLPVEGVSLADMQALTGELLCAGADITQINTLRKHLDRVKGGGLAQNTGGAQVLALILSDVIGDPVDMIASGPTSPDPTTYLEAWDILERFGLAEKAPQGVKRRLVQGASGRFAETPKPGEALFERVQNVIAGGNRMALEAVAEQAQAEGFEAHVMPSPLAGEARQMGEWMAGLAGRIRSKQAGGKRMCVIAGGETTVTVRGAGKGGRNQEVALGAARGLADVPGAVLVTLATDGGDGNSPAAGAVVTDQTLSRARELGLDPQASLDRNDSYAFFLALDDLLVTGPTLTNVNDLAVLVVEGGSSRDNQGPQVPG